MEKKCEKCKNCCCKRGKRGRSGERGPPGTPGKNGGISQFGYIYDDNALIVNGRIVPNLLGATNQNDILTGGLSRLADSFGVSVSVPGIYNMTFSSQTEGGVETGLFINGSSEPYGGTFYQESVGFALVTLNIGDTIAVNLPPPPPPDVPMAERREVEANAPILIRKVKTSMSVVQMKEIA